MRGRGVGVRNRPVFGLKRAPAAQQPYLRVLVQVGHLAREALVVTGVTAVQAGDVSGLGVRLDPPEAGIEGLGDAPVLGQANTEPIGEGYVMQLLR